MLVTRNSVYSALFLVTNFARSPCCTWSWGAVYRAYPDHGLRGVGGGAVSVCDHAARGGAAARRRTSALAALDCRPLVILLAVDFGLYISRQGGQLGMIADAPVGYGAPQAIGKILFTNSRCRWRSPRLSCSWRCGSDPAGESGR